LKTGHLLLLTGGAVLAWNIFSRKKAAESLNFIPGQFKTFAWENGNPVIVVTVLVQNTSNHIFNILSIAGNVYTETGGDEFLIGDVSDFVQKTIPPISETEIEVKMRLRLIGIVSDLITAFTSHTLFDQTVRLEAYANVDNIQVAIDDKFKLA
jgi:hypothetical protein